MSVRTARIRVLWAGALLVVPVLLYAPVIYYSLHSPFSLMDDYLHWYDLHIFESSSYFYAWLKQVVGIDGAATLYRPFWRIYNGVMWAWFGTNAPAQHLIRWILHFGTVAFFCAAFCRICAMPSGRSPRGAIGYLLPLWLMVHVWLFFPNSPATRLGNAEVLTAFFLGLCNYVAAVALSWASERRSSPQLRRSRWLWLYGLFLLGFLCLTFSKEVNVALALCLLVAYFLFACQMTKAWLAVVAGAPLFAILALAITRVYAATEYVGVGYGHAWSAYTSMANAARILLGLFQVHTSAVIGAGFVALLGALAFGCVAGILRTLRPVVKDRGKDGEPEARGVTIPLHGELAFVLFLIAQFVCMFGILAASHAVTLRYWYPLVPLLSMLLAFAGKFVLEATGGRPGWSERRVALALVVFVVFYVACNYYNFAFQAVAWHSQTNTEDELIEEVRRLGDQGEHVAVEDTRAACALMRHVRPALGFLHGIDFTVYATPPAAGQPYYFVSQEELPEQRKATTITSRRDYRFLAATSLVASILQLRREPFWQVDGGVRWLHKGRPYVWTIYHISASDAAGERLRRALGGNAMKSCRHKRSLATGAQRDLP